MPMRRGVALNYCEVMEVGGVTCKRRESWNRMFKRDTAHSTAANWGGWRVLASGLASWVGDQCAVTWAPAQTGSIARLMPCRGHLEILCNFGTGNLKFAFFSRPGKLCSRPTLEVQVCAGACPWIVCIFIGTTAARCGCLCSSQCF